MANKYFYRIGEIIVFVYLFYLLNPYFAAAGHWFSWQGTGLTLLIIAGSVLLEVSGFWRNLGQTVVTKLKK